MGTGLDESQELNCSIDTASDGETPYLSTTILEKNGSFNLNPLPHGKYTLIGVDIDTTGRRLIDEIVQISAYTPNSTYSQYIMPLMNLNPAARQRHQVRVITVGFFRMLKSMQTYKVVKTKTEIAALNEFIEWIECQRKEDEGSEGVILIYHEQRKFVPYMIIEALKKYNLLDKFMKTVKSFANGFKLAEEKCSKTIKYFSIRQLAKLVLKEKDTKEGFEGNAFVRARLAYEIAKHLALDERCKTEVDNDVAPKIEANGDEGEEKITSEKTTTSDNDKTTTSDKKTSETTEEEAADIAKIKEKLLDVLCDLASPIAQEISELAEQERILLRQNSLRPVFLQYFKTTLYHRVKAVTYRRVLAEYGFDFDKLKNAWTENKKEGLAAEINKIDDLKEDERTELTEILDCHFDPDKISLKPVVKRMKRRTSRGRPFFAAKSNTANNTNGNAPTNKENRKPRNNKNYNNQTSPDSTLRTSPTKKFRRQRRRRTPMKNNQSNGNGNTANTNGGSNNFQNNAVKTNNLVQASA